MQSSSIRIGVIILLMLIAAAGYVAVDRPLETLREAERGPAPAKTIAPRIAAVEPVRVPVATPVTPVTPVYASRPEPSPSSPIYRCRSGSRTVYTQEPCENGRIVVTSSAVDGFDSKPSDRLERLVADGRTSAAAPTVGVATRTTNPRSASVECATYAQQVADLDAEALIPNTPRGLDRLRRIREDVRTSMARAQC